MKKVTIILFCMFLYATSNFAQTSETALELIEETVMNYINGTSYNNINQIEKAFYPEANLYLDGKEGKMNVLPIATYVGYFKNRKSGEFNGRVGTILSIEYFGNIAQAKAEILIPSRNSRYVDMFILKQVEGEWKIISKTANSEASNKKGEQILFIVSNADYYGKSDIATGNSFGEIVNAYNEFNKAGFTIDFVSPNGGAIPLRYINTSNTLEKEYIYKSDFMYALEHTKKPSEINAQNYKAVYYVGGGSAMFNVPINNEIQKIAMHVYEENKGIISSVCHGTAGIVNLKTKGGNYLIKGKNVNGYPDDYENHEADYYQQFPFKITQTIEKHGGIFKYSKPNTPHLEVDGRLITGQNHLSSKLVALKIIELLKED